MYDNEAEVVEEILQNLGNSGELEMEGAEGEVDLASELLDVSSEAELDQFFGKLIGAAGKFLKSPAGNALKGVLKGLAKKALPIAGSALGNLLVPGLGGAVGGQLASGLGNMLGLELAGLPQEEMDMEVAKRLVRIANQATRSLANDARLGTDPTSAVKDAVVKSLRRNLPGLVGDALGGNAAASNAAVSNAAVSNARYRGGQSSGRWVRRGTRIILHGV